MDFAHPPFLPSFFSTAQRPFALSRKREKRETCVAVNPKASAQLILKTSNEASKQASFERALPVCLEKKLCVTNPICVFSRDVLVKQRSTSQQQKKSFLDSFSGSCPRT